MRIKKAILIFAVIWVMLHIGLIVLGFRYFSDGLTSTSRFGKEVPFYTLLKREALILIPTLCFSALLYFIDKKRG